MLATTAYRPQAERWPAVGRHVLAHFDERSVVVYQAYRPAIGLDAAAHGRFGSGWSRSRMTWVKPNFLWMMYRSGWATKEDQEVVLALTLTREGFDALLAGAVHANYVEAVYGEREAWKRAVEASDVRLQWDPDHDPFGAPVERRALQLGLRGRALARFADAYVTRIDDVTPFVVAQRERLRAGGLAALEVPVEEVYPVADPAVVARLGLDAP